jgi:Fe-S cluster biosynthesis and repair protein YggX
MTRTVFCKKLQKELPALTTPTYPGELGQKIYNEISAEAWQMWLKHQTMLINEKRLSVIEPETRQYLASEMEKFLFGGDYEMPEGYVPPENNQ